MKTENKNIIITISALISIVLLFIAITYTIFSSGVSYSNDNTASLIKYNVASSTIIATSTPKLAINVQPKVVNSSESVYLNFTYPLNATSAMMFLYCPPLISAKEVLSNKEFCNSWQRFSRLPATSTFVMINPNNQPFNVVPNFYVYTSDRPNYAQGVSSQFTVNPIPSAKLIVNHSSSSIMIISKDDPASTTTISAFFKLRIRAENDDVKILNFSATNTSFINDLSARILKAGATSTLPNAIKGKVVVDIIGAEDLGNNIYLLPESREADIRINYFFTVPRIYSGLYAVSLNSPFTWFTPSNEVKTSIFETGVNNVRTNYIRSH